MATVEYMPPADEMASQRSPVFTNPDLILPHPARPAPFPPTSPYRHACHAPDEPWQDMATALRVSSELEASGAMLPIRRGASPLILRPSLPGAWQTEEDVPTVHSAFNQNSLPVRSSPTIPDDFHSFQQPDPGALAEEEDPWAGFDSEIADGGIMSPGGTAMPSMAPIPMDPSPVEAQFEFPSFDTGRSQAIEDEDDLTSHAAMSMRAETILANAKKRLLEMEDNLSRARHSLRPNTTSSKNSIKLSLKRAAVGGISENPDSWSLELTRKRQDDGNAHSRTLSTSLLVEETNPRSHRGKRAVSAMGYLSPRGTDWEPEDDESPWTPLSHSTSNGGGQRDMLGSLEEVEHHGVDGSLNSSQNKLRHSRHSPKDNDGHSSSPRSLYLDPQAPREVKRARSSLQIRDLREQMQDLRGRLSSLRQRTREDSLQRRSMQRIESPSPFTVAPGWEDSETRTPEPSSPKASECLTSDGAEIEHALPVEISAFEPDTPDVDSDGDPFDNIPSTPASPILEPESDPYILDHGVVSPTTPPRSSLPPFPGPGTPAHEDRPDAFNYEQYFRTTALPRYTQPIDSSPTTAENTPLKVGESHSTYLRHNTQSSSSSASTTKALSPNAVHESLASSPGTEAMFSPKANGGSPPSSPFKSMPAKQALAQRPHSPSADREMPNTSLPPRAAPLPTMARASHLRQNSGDSISTVNTFATATENARGPSEDGDADEDDNVAISDLGIGFSHPGWHADQTTRTRSGTVTQTSMAHGSNAATQAATNGAAQLSIDSSTRDRRLSSDLKTPTAIERVSSQSPTSKDLSLALPQTSRLGETDKQLVHHLLAALSRACLQAEDLGDENVYERKLLRRRLDGARRVLEGGSEGVLKG